MQIATHAARATLPATKGKSRSRLPLFLRVLNWIADADCRYREKQMLKNLPDERLEDIGITREEAKLLFCRRG
ncbi:hypothetical protein [Thalassovita mangrovi]|uniref:DUF1127 domain-containing protein n=1 Tax=Thalassovita mangrovi TaxID=2692236 RepID=A0A6L8LFD8_9RHOB|nr:hypothetical protein [Thalassovita mangrovi]MYM54787.1 hypothetical protein [Thalassovita mangrovi]